METTEFLKEAEKLQPELIEHRRYLHEHAEVGFDVPKTEAYIVENLQKIGVKHKKCGRSGIVATLGKTNGNGAFLLRADVDGLPITEDTGLSFSCKDGRMHACGHDLHATILLGVAKLLKAWEGELNGEVRLLFQPAEETLEGAKDCIENGVLKGVKGAMMIHVLTALPLPSGELIVSAEGNSAPSADFFTVRVQGKGCHGATPQNGVDAALISAKILLGLQEIIARELPPNETAALTVGKLVAGMAGNAIADTGALEGTFRCFDEKLRSFAKKRIKEISKTLAKAYRAEAEVIFTSGCPTLKNDGKLSKFALKCAKELIGERAFLSSELGEKKSLGGSEDFSYIAKEIPAVMVGLTAGEKDKGFEYPLHHPKVKFDETALKIGVAFMAYTAFQWFEK